MRGLHAMYNQNTYGGFTLGGDCTRCRVRILAGRNVRWKVFKPRRLYMAGVTGEGQTGGDYIPEGVRMNVRTWIYCLRSDDLSVGVRPYPPSKKSPFKLRLPIRLYISYTHRRAPNDVDKPTPLPHHAPEFSLNMRRKR